MSAGLAYALQAIGCTSALAYDVQRYCSCSMFPRELKNWDNTQLGTDHQSVQSGAGNVSFNKTAL